MSLRMEESEPTDLDFSRSSSIFLSADSKKSGSVRSFWTELPTSIMRLSKSGSFCECCMTLLNFSSNASQSFLSPNEDKKDQKFFTARSVSGFRSKLS